LYVTNLLEITNIAFEANSFGATHIPPTFWCLVVGAHSHFQLLAGLLLALLGLQAAISAWLRLGECGNEKLNKGQASSRRQLFDACFLVPFTRQYN
jgi:hypothetical protein